MLIRSMMTTLGGYLHGKCIGEDHSWMGWRVYSQLSNDAKMTVWLRTLFAVGSYASTMASIFLMPVSISVSITMTVTFITSVIAYFLGGEKLSIREICIIVIGFTGVLMMVNPNWFNDSSFISKRDKNEDEKYPHYYLGAFCALLFTVFSALNFIVIRKMNAKMATSMKTYLYGV